MNIIQIIILSIVQGITEWLPISSDGHLVLFERLLQLRVAVSFDIFLHLGSLLVIIIFFRKPIAEFLKHLFQKPNHWPLDRQRWWQYLLVSTVITGLIGIFLYPRIESFRNLDFTACGFLLTSVFVLASFLGRPRKSLGYPEAIFLGLAQGLAVLPGVSRSGLVLSLALLLGVGRKQAFDYTFLLAVPAIAASFLLAVKDFAWQGIYLLGLGITIIVGFMALGLLKNLVSRDKFYLFFIYTLVLGLSLLLFF